MRKTLTTASLISNRKAGRARSSFPARVLNCLVIPFTMHRDAAAEWGFDINLEVVPVLPSTLHRWLPIGLALQLVCLEHVYFFSSCYCRCLVLLSSFVIPAYAASVTMPVSHIGLTVSHLPTSSSFFLSALQPLGYRYIGQQGHQVGFGIREADFFLCQETPG
jgi:hypothetical protein